jgi:energy-coupling factor transporter ATP-binding protein EcfA2
MITSMRIKGYRAFSDFSLNGLGRINLLVGKNNTGKSSLLETLALLWGRASLSALWQILARRGEHPLLEIIPGRPVQQEVDLGHIFTGHQAKIGGEFSITTRNDRPARSITYKLVEAKPEENPALFNILASQEPAGAAMALRISGHGINIPPIPLTQRGSLRQDVFSQAFAMSRATQSQGENAQYITTETLTAQQLQLLWNDVTLKPEEDKVVRALTFIDPAIERIAPVTSQPFFGQGIYRGGFLIRRKDEERVPIGSLGDGIWRMFALAVVLSRTKDGLVLIDEIDTGLHHTVMEKMWQFVNDVSKEFKTQVFATTHSYDCVHALASICKDNDDAADITIHRIESGQSESIPFTESEIRIAAQQHIELR